MKDFFVSKDLLLFSNSMGMNSAFSVRGFSVGEAEDAAALSVTVTSVPPVPSAEIEYVGGIAMHAPNTATYTIDLPEGVQQGDFVLVFSGVGCDSDRDRVLSPSGFTTIKRPFVSSGIWNTFNYLGYKFMGGTPDTQLTIAGSAEDPAAFGAVTVVHIWRGVNQLNPLDVTPVSLLGQGPNDRLVRAGPLTPITPGAVLLAMCSTSDGYGFTLTPSEGYTNTVQRQYDPSAGYTMCISSKPWEGGEEPQVTWNDFSIPLRSPTSANSWNGIMLALRPAT